MSRQNKDKTVRHSASDIAEMENDTDLARLDALKDEEIDYSDIPDHGDAAEFWADAVALPRNKQGVYIRLDADLLDWFKSQGPGYQTRINAVLRSYMEHQR